MREHMHMRAGLGRGLGSRGASGTGRGGGASNCGGRGWGTRERARRVGWAGLVWGEAGTCAVHACVPACGEPGRGGQGLRRKGRWVRDEETARVGLIKGVAAPLVAPQPWFRPAPNAEELHLPKLC